MGSLAGTSCYLVGPIEHDSMFGKDWRDVVLHELITLGVHVYNPLDRPHWMKEIENTVPPVMSRDEVMKTINTSKDAALVNQCKRSQMLVRKICQRYVATCDFIFCYLSNTKTYGSTEELALAASTGKPIIAVCPDGMPSLWIYDILDQETTFSKLTEAIEHIKAVDQCKVQLDALKWIFIGDHYEPKLFGISRNK